MTDKEIKDLAREYSEQNPPQGIEDAILRENAISLNAQIFEKHLQWLTERYAIAEKSKVLEERDRYFPDDTDGCIAAIMCDAMLIRLFGKELFNTDKK